MRINLSAKDIQNARQFNQIYRAYNALPLNARKSKQAQTYLRQLNRLSFQIAHAVHRSALALENSTRKKTTAPDEQRP